MMTNQRPRPHRGTYNGWKNYATWNIALWISNEETLYRIATTCDTYDEFLSRIADHVGDTSATPDGVAWEADCLDINALNELIEEMAP